MFQSIYWVRYFTTAVDLNECYTLLGCQKETVPDRDSHLLKKVTIVVSQSITCRRRGKVLWWIKTSAFGLTVDCCWLFQQHMSCVFVYTDLLPTYMNCLGATVDVSVECPKGFEEIGVFFCCVFDSVRGSWQLHCTSLFHNNNGQPLCVAGPRVLAHLNWRYLTQINKSLLPA